MDAVLMDATRDEGERRCRRDALVLLAEVRDYLCRDHAAAMLASATGPAADVACGVITLRQLAGFAMSGSRRIATAADARVALTAAVRLLDGATLGTARRALVAPAHALADAGLVALMGGAS